MGQKDIAFGSEYRLLNNHILLINFTEHTIFQAETFAKPQKIR